MKVTQQKKLDPGQIKDLSSGYLDHGIKQESWQIVSVDVDGPVLQAQVHMNRTCTSPTDNVGFHLSVCTAMEFLSQLSNIYFHVWAGYEKKIREVWMRECSIKCKDPIRDAENISVRLEVKSLKQAGDITLGVIQYVISDHAGGRIEGRIKGMMS